MQLDGHFRVYNSNETVSAVTSAYFNNWYQANTSLSKLQTFLIIFSLKQLFLCILRLKKTSVIAFPSVIYSDMDIGVYQLES